MSKHEKQQRLVETIALLRVPGIGKGRFKKLLSHFGSTEKILSAKSQELESVSGISSALALAIKNECDLKTAQTIASQIEKLGWVVLYPDSPEFPPLLKEISDSPVILFRLGEPISPSEKLVGIVGTRHASEKGKRFAHKLALDLAANGIVVVSGMAEGIDSSAHLGAIENSGKTFAVWGTSLDHVYPSSNRDLAKTIQKHGALYSEYLPGTTPEKAYFPERNRIISGMSEAVIVIEAGVKSGALITAEHAIRQGRDLFAVPGSPEAMTSIGTNALIKKGARLLTSAQDLFDELPRLIGKVVPRAIQKLPELTDTERQMIDLLSDGPMQLDHLSRLANLPVSDILEYLLALELKGLVQELSGKRFVLNESTV